MPFASAQVIWSVGRTGKKGSDKGIDGIKVFVDDNSGKAKRVIVQVKSGHVKSGDIRDLGYAARCAEKLRFSGRLHSRPARLRRQMSGRAVPFRKAHPKSPGGSASKFFSDSLSER